MFYILEKSAFLSQVGVPADLHFLAKLGLFVLYVVGGDTDHGQVYGKKKQENRKERRSF